jgi:hypothetical protein
VEEMDCSVCKLNLSIETIATQWCGKPTWTRDMSYSPALPPIGIVLHCPHPLFQTHTQNTDRFVCCKIVMHKYCKDDGGAGDGGGWGKSS